MALLSWRAKKRLLRRLERAFAGRFAGVGTILAFHRLASAKRRTWRSNQHIENTGDFLEQTVRYLRQQGYDLVPLPEVPARLAAPAAGRFAVITFDDGYADSYAVAYPVLAALGVPFTVYVTTQFIERTAPIWWYLLEEHLETATRLEVEHRGRRLLRATGSLAEKRAAFVAVEAMFLAATGAESAALASQLFGERAVREACDRLMMTWEQVVELQRSGRVTIGAHGRRHTALAALPLEEARQELSGSRQDLEARLGVPVEHAAFPYGSRGFAGPREVALARACGFVTATTTRQANLFPAHVGHLQALPRVFPLSSDPGDLSLVVSGTAAAWRYRGRRVVTVR